MGSRPPEQEVLPESTLDKENTRKRKRKEGRMTKGRRIHISHIYSHLSIYLSIYTLPSLNSTQLHSTHFDLDLDLVLRTSSANGLLLLLPPLPPLILILLLVALVVLG